MATTSGPAWASVLPVPAAFAGPASCIPQTELRAITLAQLRSLYELVQQVVPLYEIVDAFSKEKVSLESANLYHLNDHFVKPLSATFQCSFVELVAKGPQAPKWFVSHWWGTAFKLTMALLCFHSTSRDLKEEEERYWICTFANNQHNLKELGGHLVDTPFVRAILLPECQGTVALLNKEATTLKRIWCVLELFVSTAFATRTGTPRLYDLASWLPAGLLAFGKVPVPACATLQLDNGDGTMREVAAEKGGSFPYSVAQLGMKIDIAQAEATQEVDRRNILHMIAETPETQWTAPAPQVHAKFLELNTAVRLRFAPGAMWAAAKTGKMAELQELLADPFLGSVNVSNADGTSPLFAACQGGHVEAVKLLLAARADASLGRSYDSISPAFIAAQGGHSEVLRCLLASQAQLHGCRADGASPALIAAENGRGGALRILMEARADVSLPDRNGITPVFAAAAAGRTETLLLLLKSKAEVDAANRSGATPLMAAAQKGHCEALKVLLLAKADLSKEYGFKTAMYFAGEAGEVGAAGLLREAWSRSRTPTEHPHLLTLYGEVAGWTCDGCGLVDDYLRFECAENCDFSLCGACFPLLTGPGRQEDGSIPPVSPIRGREAPRWEELEQDPSTPQQFLIRSHVPESKGIMWRVRYSDEEVETKYDMSLPCGFPENGTLIKGVPEKDEWIRVTSHGKGDFLVAKKNLVALTRHSYDLEKMSPGLADAP